MGGRKDRDTESQQRVSSVGAWGVKVKELWEQRVTNPKRRGRSTATRGDRAFQAARPVGSKAWRLN